jgi:uncharacterized protein YbcV (DUF1398 family)
VATKKERTHERGDGEHREGATAGDEDPTEGRRLPVLAEVLRQAGVQRNIWVLPSAQSVYLASLGPVVTQGQPLATGTLAVPSFDEERLVRALRTDQAGQSTFPEFLQASWDAGVVSYDVDFDARTVTYCGADADSYTESYSATAPSRTSLAVCRSSCVCRELVGHGQLADGGVRGQGG